MDIGLPIREDWTLSFEVESDQPSGRAHGRRLRRIGSDGEGVVPIYLDEDRNGCVIVGEAQIDGTEWFTNSSAEQFGECLLYYQQYRQMGPTIVEEDDALKLIETIEAAMRSVDARAFADTNNYWPVVIEQMRDGML